MRCQLVCLVVVFAGVLALPVEAYVVTGFPPSVYDPDAGVMDNRLGLSGQVVEDCEDADLADGLSASAGAPILSPNRNWDGVNVWNFAGEEPGDSITFTFYPPLSSVGFGLSDFDRDPEHYLLRVNDLDPMHLADIAELELGLDHANARNGYIIVNSEGTEAISSVTFTRYVVNDSVQFDHIALVPEPASGILLALGVLAVKRRRG